MGARCGKSILSGTWYLVDSASCQACDAHTWVRAAGCAFGKIAARPEKPTSQEFGGGGSPMGWVVRAAGAGALVAVVCSVPATLAGLAGTAGPAGAASPAAGGVTVAEVSAVDEAGLDRQLDVRRRFGLQADPAHV